MLNYVWKTPPEYMECAVRVPFPKVCGTVQPSMGLPPLLPLLWQGMLSFASSAALDEMFGAHASAAKGYAKAATLAELLQHQAADCKVSPRGLKSPREPGTQHQGAPASGGTRTTGISGGSSPGEVVHPTCISSFEQQVADMQNPDAQQQMKNHSAHLRGDEEGRGSRLDQSSDQGHAPSFVTSGSGAGGLMFPDDLQENQPGPASQLAGWRWLLDSQQQQQLQGYISTLAKRHAACMRQRR